ncbi:MAG: type II toxin-antitoxin system VapB family antitoxin [Verrucomicrobiae bacterium]|nr:type II toxin-antitoxin system VapB family antitoxin [Verrucomicrobiae bacterium]
MRTNIVIDDRLMRQAMAAGGHATKRATVEEGLRLLVRMKRQRSARSLRGRVAWTGDLDAMRLDHGAR